MIKKDKIIFFMTTVEGNKLIAEFMGYEYIPFNSPDHTKPKGCKTGYWQKKKSEGLLMPNSERYVLGAKLSYDYCWNSMMQVIQKIEALPYHAFVTIWHRKEGCSIEAKLSFYNEDLQDFWVNIESKSQSSYDKLTTVWTAAVRFIEWLNKNNLPISIKTSFNVI